MTEGDFDFSDHPDRVILKIICSTAHILLNLKNLIHMKTEFYKSITHQEQVQLNQQLPS